MEKPLRYVAPGTYRTFILDTLSKAFQQVEETETMRLRGDSEAVWPVPSFALDKDEGDVVVTFEVGASREAYWAEMQRLKDQRAKQRAS